MTLPSYQPELAFSLFTSKVTILAHVGGYHHHILTPLLNPETPVDYAGTKMLSRHHPTHAP